MSQEYTVLDPLSAVLSHLKPRSYVTGALSAGDPWSLQLPAFQGIKCYMVVTGECWLAVQGQDPVQMREGNCVVLPHGRPFILASDLALSPVDARVIVSSVRRHNGVLPITPGDDFLLLGSHFDLDGDARFLLGVLPSLVLLADEERCGSMRWAVERILSEMREPRPGGTLVAQQVAYTVLIDALRLFLGEQGHRTGWFHALAEPQIGTALSCIHEDPARTWTLDELARASGLSRTALAQKFRDSVGETPIAYLTRWRMTLAASSLREDQGELAAVALNAGYKSQSAFCAAFKRHSGLSPRQYVFAKAQTDTGEHATESGLRTHRVRA